MRTRFKVLVLSTVLMVSGCLTPGEAKVAHTVIDVLTATCLMQHAEDPNVKKFCHWEEDKADTVKELIGTQKDVLAKARREEDAVVSARACPEKR